MKDSLDKEVLKAGIVAVVLAAIIPVLAQELLSSTVTPTNIAAFATTTVTA